MKGKNEKFKIYLAGSVTETEYRKQTLEHYSDDFNLFEPLREVEEKLMGFSSGDIIERKVEITNEIRKTIVEEDKKAILTCDIVVAYMNKSTGGTTMEVCYAHDHNKPVYIINPEQNLVNDIWLVYHSEKFFSNIDECFEFLKSEQEKASKYEVIEFKLNIAKVQSLLDEQDRQTRHACAEAVTTTGKGHMISKDQAHARCMNVSARINAGQIPIGWYMD
ncbi:nucleoside 2-deoxyribosyltransferase [Candidatus Pacearchaeota archaeon]|nr:nucleoside 2-deoxyribosyltransferase [Candidatus Pacearchaeota archaeon]